ncbi:FecCD family ABC transporter permease [Chelatococcus asaccharovorans]|uniref:FecCD family ABC transporter permease n=1 Tax=Chelatococcus asaccharovorans TaxID=28210 RepID=UPI00224C712F|nr:iron ABC transporter permease [Chelatococcus asaccharovorans]CAH1655536.1 Iron complex transport system permease protein [Chelatococcus asaccharovorans]CAH1685393.1 Iron complex transport system permease protein [Chelatococcus asaccharovorans]
MHHVGSDEGAISALYTSLADRRRAVLLFGVCALFMSLLVDVATGPALLPITAVVGSVLRLAKDPTVDAIVWTIRLPTAFVAIAVGAALGLSGGIMQTILNNPLASSYTLGVSAGAGFGAALVIVLGVVVPLPEAWAIPVMSFLFAGLACAGVYGIGSLRGASPEMLVLGGIALLFLFQALLALLQFAASPEALQQIVFWLFGSLQKATWAKLWIISIVLGVALPLLLVDAWRLTALKLGDDRARGLGVDVARLRLRAFAIISALTGVAVAFVGTIGFVGLVAPHIARMLVGEDQRGLLPASAVCGALLLSLASIASKSVLPGAIVPIGIVTSLIGVPFFVWLVTRSRRAFW